MSYDSNQQANLAPVYRCDSPMPSLEALIEITSVPQNGQYFQPLEEIEFEITIENTGNVTLDSIEADFNNGENP